MAPRSRKINLKETLEFWENHGTSRKIKINKKSLEKVAFNKLKTESIKNSYNKEF